MGDHVEHYGTPRHSGRYPWGSGKNPQRSKNWITRADELHKQGLSDKEVAKALGMNTGEYRARRKIYGNDVKMEEIRRCVRMRETGMSPTAISKETGIPESTVRSYLQPNKANRVTRTETIAKGLLQQLETKPYLDVGEGVNRQLGISEEQLKAALIYLSDRGYSVQNLSVKQVTNPNQNTTVRVLAKEGVTKKELFDNRDKITSPDGLYFEDYGEVIGKNKPVVPVSSKRVQVRYAEDGGGEKDGVIELRPGVEDISLGARNYAQVRIAVDGTHYLKGMAVYSNNLPDGVDILFNTSKHSDTPMMGDKSTVLKVLNKNEDGTMDQANPFGANFRNHEYIGSDGQTHVSAINIVNDDKDWDKWKKSLSSQWLSKQPPELAKRQLDLDYKGRENEFNAIMDIPNPTVRRQLLETFASECDSAAVHLKGAAMPRQGTFAILPVMSLKDTEVYAPNYNDGEEVVLVRFPHAGTFEMPRLRVNNQNPEAKEVLGTNPAHAIGINAHVANQLSGADYDGDTVLVIPTKGQKIKFDTSSPDSELRKLRDFNPKDAYRKSDEAVPTGNDGFMKQRQMGGVSNLINDMQIMGASEDEIARAVRHSMVVIDAEKHNLDWRQSFTDNRIAELKEKYQGGSNAGAATLISRRKRTVRDMPEREQVYSVNNMTPEERAAWDAGVEAIYRPTGRTYIDKKGNVVLAKVKKQDAPYEILERESAREMSSGYRIENVYADYADECKALANRARAELRKTGRLQMNSEAREIYKDEVRSLNDKLNRAALNAPKERQAHLVAGKAVSVMCQTDPSLRSDDNKDRLKKVQARQLELARERVGARRYSIEITPNEWKAIQAGAISDTKLTQILRYADIDKVRQLATPRTTRGMSSSARSLARQLLRSGYPQSVVAERVGVSVTTLAKEFDNFNNLGGDG